MGGLGFTLAAAGASLLLFQGDGRLFPALAVGGRVSSCRAFGRPFKEAAEGQPRTPPLSEDLLSARRRAHRGVLLPVCGGDQSVSPLYKADDRSFLGHRAARYLRLSRDGQLRQPHRRAGRARGLRFGGIFPLFGGNFSARRAGAAGSKCSPSALRGRLPRTLSSMWGGRASSWGIRARSPSAALRRPSPSFRGTSFFCPFWGRCSLYPAYPSSFKSYPIKRGRSASF